MCSMSRQILCLLWKIKCKFCLDIPTVNPVLNIYRLNTVPYLLGALL